MAYDFQIRPEILLEHRSLQQTVSSVDHQEDANRIAHLQFHATVGIMERLDALINLFIDANSIACIQAQTSIISETDESKHREESDSQNL